MPRIATATKDDAGYFDAMSKAIFTAGLNWGMVEKKWPDFQKAFDDFAPDKVARFSGKQVQLLMNNAKIVRNEKKILATIENANTFVNIQKEFGSVNAYLDSFGKMEKLVLEDLQHRFKFMGPSTARMFLWIVGYPLTPTREESVWLKSHGEHT